jgi:alanyl-tRNA synthetase
MEIWNNVFLEFIKEENWNFQKAKQQNVDTWMGLERLTTVLNWEVSVYETEIFKKIILEIENVLWKSS